MRDLRVSSAIFAEMSVFFGSGSAELTETVEIFVVVVFIGGFSERSGFFSAGSGAFSADSVSIFGAFSFGSQFFEIL